MSYRATTIANYLIEKSRPEGMTPLKLLKMVYLCHAWNLALNDKPLIFEEIVAWKYGPVIRSLYNIVGGSRQPITEPIACLMERIVPDDCAVIDAVFDRYNHLTGIQLSQLTHSSGSPWQLVWDRNKTNAPIPQEMIKKYYRQKLNEHRSKNAAQQ